MSPKKRELMHQKHRLFPVVHIESLGVCLVYVCVFIYRYVISAERYLLLIFVGCVSDLSNYMKYMHNYNLVKHT